MLVVPKLFDWISRYIIQLSTSFVLLNKQYTEIPNWLHKVAMWFSCYNYFHISVYCLFNCMNKITILLNKILPWKTNCLLSLNHNADSKTILYFMIALKNPILLIGWCVAKKWLIVCTSQCQHNWSYKECSVTTIFSWKDPTIERIKHDKVFPLMLILLCNELKIAEYKVYWL